MIYQSLKALNKHIPLYLKSADITEIVAVVLPLYLKRIRPTAPASVPLSVIFPLWCGLA